MKDIKINPLIGIVIILITSLLMEIIHDKVSSRLVRPFIAAAIAGVLTLFVLLMKRTRN